MTNATTTHALTAYLMEKYRQHGFYLRPFNAGDDLRYAIVFIHDGDEVSDPNLSPCRQHSAESYGYYRLDPEDCDRLSTHNQSYRGRTSDSSPDCFHAGLDHLPDTGDGMRVTRTTVAELVDFCESDNDWRPGGQMLNEHFYLHGRSRSWQIEVMQAPEPETLASLVSVNAAITLKVNGEVVHLTWGEATELINALVLITAVGMFG